MSREKTLKNRLTPEQEAQIFSLLVTQNDLRYKIIAPFSTFISSSFAFFLACFILLSKFKPLQDFLVSIYNKMIDFSHNDKIMLARYYDAVGGRIRVLIQDFNSILLTTLPSKGIAVKDIIVNYDRLFKEKFFESFSSEDTAKILEIKRALITIYTSLNYVNPHHPDSVVREAIQSTHSDEVAQANIAELMNIPLAKLSVIIMRNIKALQDDMEKYSKIDINSFSYRTLLLESPSERNLLFFSLAFISVITITSNIFLVEPLLVKTFSLLDGSNKGYNRNLIYQLKPHGANNLIGELKNYNKKLLSLSRTVTILHVILSTYLAFLLTNQVLYGDTFSIGLSLLVISFLSIYLKEIIKIGYSYYQDYCLDSKLLERVSFLNQLTFASNQKSWVVTKKETLGASYYSLSIASKKQVSTEIVCEAIKYSLLVHGINTIADGRDRIIVPGDLHCDRKKIEMIKNNLEQSLERLVKLKTLKQDFLRITKLTGGRYKYYVKRDKNHSIVAVLTQEILPEYQNILTLGHLKSIFTNFSIKIADGKLLLKGFESIDQETEQKFRQLLHSSKEKIRPEPQNNPPSSPIESISKYLRISSRSQALPSNPPVAKRESQYIRWGKDVLYNSEDRTCNVYKFQSSSQKNLFVLSKLTREDFQDQASFDHFLDKIKNPKRVAAKGEQGFVRVPDLSCRDNSGDRFLARWKLKLLGPLVGNLRGMGEEIRAKTGERLIVVRSLADHKAVAKMYKM